MPETGFFFVIDFLGVSPGRQLLWVVVVSFAGALCSITERTGGGYMSVNKHSPWLADCLHRLHPVLPFTGWWLCSRFTGWLGRDRQAGRSINRRRPSIELHLYLISSITISNMEKAMQPAEAYFPPLAGKAVILVGIKMGIASKIRLSS